MDPFLDVGVKAPAIPELGGTPLVLVNEMFLEHSS